MFEPFANVPAYPLVFPVFWGAAAMFVLVTARHLRVFAAARNATPYDRIPVRLWGAVRYGLAQTRMFRDPAAGLMHFGIFWGFVLLTVGTANIVTRRWSAGRSTDCCGPGSTRWATWWPSSCWSPSRTRSTAAS
jgi:hypothetical protein